MKSRRTESNKFDEYQENKKFLVNRHECMLDMQEIKETVAKKEREVKKRYDDIESRENQL